jgi:hypothetical protein
VHVHPGPTPHRRAALPAAPPRPPEAPRRPARRRRRTSPGAWRAPAPSVAAPRGVAPRGALRRGAVERGPGRRESQRPDAVGGHRAVLRRALRPRRRDGEALQGAGLAGPKRHRSQQTARTRTDLLVKPRKCNRCPIFSDVRRSFKFVVSDGSLHPSIVFDSLVPCTQDFFSWSLSSTQYDEPSCVRQQSSNVRLITREPDQAAINR